MALVTGVSRRAGIGWAVADRLTRLGATVTTTGWRGHDEEMVWGADPATAPAPPFDHGEHDLEDPAVPADLVDDVVARHGALDVLVAVHARSSTQGLGAVTATELDRCWAVNVRSVVLLAQRFAEVHDPARPGGRMVWFTSGQHVAPMGGEIAYAATKGALHQLTRSLADVLVGRGIVANCINPGPVDTGWADAGTRATVATCSRRDDGPRPTRSRAWSSCWSATRVRRSSARWSTPRRASAADLRMRWARGSGHDPARRWRRSSSVVPRWSAPVASASMAPAATSNGVLDDQRVTMQHLDPTHAHCFAVQVDPRTCRRAQLENRCRGDIRVECHSYVSPRAGPVANMDSLHQLIHGRHGVVGPGVPAPCRKSSGDQRRGSGERLEVHETAKRS